MKLPDSGAHLSRGESLTHMHGVRLVRPVPNALDSTAFVYLAHGELPDLGAWSAQFAAMSNGSHIFRGVEVTVSGLLEIGEGGRLVLDGNDVRPPLFLEPMDAASKIQWDATMGAPKPLDLTEKDAFLKLLNEVQRQRGGSLNAIVTGPLRKGSDHGYVLQVRQFSLPKGKDPAIDFRQRF